ncbi:unnamed protein product, partial [Mesorhabditis belari]|uniref:Uncharacterized protein n=1 Tax=Mesorhabditis belari TaxID=2138241 RepID=A0AAF3FEG9_9BILA
MVLALLMIDSCRGSPTRHLVCSDLLNLYKTMPILIKTIEPDECQNAETSCFLATSLLLEKARERTSQLRKKLSCLPSAPELVVYDQEEICSLIESAPLYSTKLLKRFGDTEFGALCKQISSDFQPLFAEKLTPIYKRLSCEYREEGNQEK